MLYWIFWFILKLTSLLFYPFKVTGREHIPASGGFIIACNHISNLDPLIIGLSMHRKMTYMAKDTLFKNSILSFFLRHGEAFPIKRGASDVRSIREAMRRLKRGLPLLIFPEGTRAGSRAARAKTQRVESGVGFLVAKSAVPVVPVKITGSDQVLPPGARWFHRHPITVTYGPPIPIPEKSKYPLIAETVMKYVEAVEEV